MAVSQPPALTDTALVVVQQPAMLWSDQYLKLLNMAVPPPSQSGTVKSIDWTHRAMKAFRLVDLGRLHPALDEYQLLLNSYDLPAELRAVMQHNMQYVQEHLLVETSSDRCHTQIAVPEQNAASDTLMEEKEVETMFERHGVVDPPHEHTSSKYQPADEEKEADEPVDTYQVRLIERDVTKWVRPQRRLDRVVVDKQVETVIVKSSKSRT